MDLRNSNRPWTDRELRYLIEYWPSNHGVPKTYRIFCSVLGRTEAAVTAAARKLGLGGQVAGRRKTRCDINDIEAALKLHGRGTPWRDACIWYRLSPSTCYRVDPGRKRRTPIETAGYRPAAMPDGSPMAVPRVGRWSRLRANVRRFFGFFNPGGVRW